MRRRERVIALGVPLVFVATARLSWTDPAAYVEAVYLCVTTLGYGHLLGGFLFARNRALPRPAFVTPLLWGAFVGVSIATLMAVYAAALRAWPATVLALFAVSAWHIVENDLARGTLPAAASGTLPPIVGAGRRNWLALAGTAVVVLLGAATPEIAELAPAVAIPLPAPPLVELFALVTGYHLISWFYAAAARARRGDDPRAWRRLLAVHLVPIAASGLMSWFGPSAADLRLLLFGPAHYLFWSSLHVAQTALARRGQRPAESESRPGVAPCFPPHARAVPREFST